MTIIRLASAVVVASALAGPAAAQQPPRQAPLPPAAPVPAIPSAPPVATVPPQPPAPPAPWRFMMPDLSELVLPDLSQVQLELENLQLPDLSHIQIPDLSHIQLPDLSHLEIPQVPMHVDLHAWQSPMPAPAPAPPPAPPYVYTNIDARGSGRVRQGEYDGLYDQARSLIDNNQYDRAVQSLDRLIAADAPQAAGAMYWKAYSLARISRRPDALTTLADLRSRFPKSPWVKDAQALEVELKQASGQTVTADAQSSDELKLLALRSLMQSDPEAALPVIEKILGGSSSVRVKDRALFVVSQSRSARGRTLIVGVAKGNDNPDLQLRAIRYIGQMGGAESAQTLDEVYRVTSEERVKREIIRALGNANGKERLLALARGETSADLRGDAVRALGNMSASAELEQLYRSETSVEVKKRILQGMQNGNAADKLAAIARAESDPELKRSAILYLGNMRGTVATDTLTALYAAESSEEIKVSIIRALGSHNSDTALVSLARAERNQVLKEHIVRALGNMRTPVARDYLLELLK